MYSESEMQREVLNNVLNSTMLFILFMGIYSMTFIACIYACAFRKTDANPVVVIALVALYTISISELGIQWHMTKQIFIDNGDTRVTAYISSLTGGGNVITMVNDILQEIGYILADALLLWRCYHVVGKSTQSMIVPFFLFFCEIGLAICVLALTGTYALFNLGSFTQKQENIQNIVYGAFTSVTAATSLSATYIIYRRIATSTDQYIKNKSCYQRIIWIVIESSFIYSLASALTALSAILDSLPVSQSSSEIDALTLYFTCTSVFTTGFAPTLMVAQLSIASSSSHTDISSGGVSTLRIRPLQSSSQGTQSNQFNNITSQGDASISHDLKDAGDEVV